MAQFKKINEEKRAHYVDALDAVEDLIVQLSDSDVAAGTLGDAEALIKQGGNEVMRKLTQGYLNQSSAREEKLKKLESADGETRTHRRPDCRRQIETIFGGVEFNRIGYRGLDIGLRYPLDAQLNLPPDKYSHGLRSEIAHLIADQSFDAVLETLQRHGGGALPKRQLQDAAAALIQDFESYYSRPLEFFDPGKHILVITADGKGISIHNQDLREATRKAAEADQKKKKKRLQPGEKRSRKRMATVVSVYEIAPYIRTPEQMLGEKAEKPPPRPKPQNKRVWADVTEDMGTLIKQGFEEALRRDPDQKMHWVVLIDGQPELIRQVEKNVELYGVEVAITQDFIHVTEYLWKASHALYPKNADRREEWVYGRSRELLRGNAQNVASGLRRTATLYKLNEEQRIPVDTAAAYIENSQSRLRYDISLKHGFPIATGVIEGACRYLVKDRMDITGARWRLKSAEAVLKLRSLKASGDLNAYLKFHFQQEKERNYPWVGKDENQAAS
jgi:hypothetical protein